MGKGVKGAASGERHENIEMYDTAQQGSYSRDMTKDQIEEAVRSGSVPHVNTSEAVNIAKNGGWEVDALMTEMQNEINAQGGENNGHFDLEFKNPKYFTYLIVAFASMGGMLSGLDQSLISGANLFLPKDLGLNDRQNSLVNSAMSLGAVAGAIILSPANEYLGRRWAIIFSCVLYTIGGALEAGAMDYAMIITARLILGVGVGLEGGTVPVYVAETVESRLRGNMVSLYQFAIAFGEVLGYAVAAMFVTVSLYLFGSKHKKNKSLIPFRSLVTGDTFLEALWSSLPSWVLVCSICPNLLASSCTRASPWMLSKSGSVFVVSSRWSLVRSSMS
jgi:MFS family permease